MTSLQKYIMFSRRKIWKLIQKDGEKTLYILRRLRPRYRGFRILAVKSLFGLLNH